MNCNSHRLLVVFTNALLFFVAVPQEDGVVHRNTKLQHGGQQRDQQALEQLEPWITASAQRAAAHHQRGAIDPHLELFRWMLEEFRVSLFAQQLGTSLSVSAQRLEKQWAQVAP